MPVVNEAVARKANQEDDCTGRFWEGCFKSQAFLDERALLACMAYVDLNLVRASMAASPETSDHTRVKHRIESVKNNQSEKQTVEAFVGSKAENIDIPFRLIDYLELVDWTGRIIKGDKRGQIDQALPPILARLSFNQDAWRTLTAQFEHQFRQWIGSEHIVRQVYSDKHYRRIPSPSWHKALLG